MRARVRLSFRAMRPWLIVYVVVYSAGYAVGAIEPFDVAGICTGIGMCVTALYSDVYWNHARHRLLTRLQAVLVLGPVAWFLLTGGDVAATIAGSLASGALATATLERIRRQTGAAYPGGARRAVRRWVRGVRRRFRWTRALRSGAR